MTIIEDLQTCTTQERIEAFNLLINHPDTEPIFETKVRTIIAEFMAHPDVRIMKMFKVGDFVRTNSRWNEDEELDSGIITEMIELKLPSIYQVIHNGIHTSELIVSNSGEVDYVCRLDDRTNFHWSWLEKVY